MMGNESSIGVGRLKLASISKIVYFSSSFFRQIFNTKKPYFKEASFFVIDFCCEKRMMTVIVMMISGW